MNNITLDNLISKLKYERDSRINAVKSGMFCDNEISLKNAYAIDQAINRIEEVRIAMQF